MAREVFTFNFQVSTQDDSPKVETTAPILIESHPPTRKCRDKGLSVFRFLTDVETLLDDKSTQNLECDVVLSVVHNGESRPDILKVRQPVRSTIDDYDQAVYQEIERKRIDLIPGTYEGGLKLWECSLDLCRYLLKYNLKPEFALELGCGHGLPGCILLRNGAKVLLSDYNEFVLKDVTVANVVLNTQNLTHTEVANSVTFGAGDWLAMSECIKKNQHGLSKLPSSGRFDLVLAAETTYTHRTSADTALLLAKHLAPVGGIGLVATKRYYFGCGGGSDAFRKAAETQQVHVTGVSYKLLVTTLETFDNGSGNIRELLQVVLAPVDE